MGAGSAPKPKAIPKPPPVEHDVAPEVLQARLDVRRQAQAAAGRGSTDLTQGTAPFLVPVPIGTKGYLGGAG